MSDKLLSCSEQERSFFMREQRKERIKIITDAPEEFENEIPFHPADSTDVKVNKNGSN